MVLILSIFYTNYESYDRTSVEYTMRVQAVRHTEFKTVQVGIGTVAAAVGCAAHTHLMGHVHAACHTQTLPLPGTDGVNRTLLNRHGIRVVVEQSGKASRGRPTAAIACPLLTRG